MPYLAAKDYEDDLIDVRAIRRTLWRRRGLIAMTGVLGMAIAGAVTLTQPKIYMARTTLMPVDASSDRLSRGLASVSPILADIPAAASPERAALVPNRLVALLESQALAKRLLESHPGLVEHLRLPAKEGAEPSFNEAYRALSSILSASVEPTTGIIEVAVKLPDPVAAADTANLYVAALEAYLQANSFTAAKRYRGFLEAQLKVAAAELAQTEANLRAFQETNMLVSLDGQTQATVQAYANLKSQLITKEVELRLQQRSVSQDDIQFIGLQQEVTQLRSSLGELERGASGGMLAFKDVPRLGVQLAQLQRNLALKQKSYETLTQQLDLARMQEAQQAMAFEVIDEALPPDRPAASKQGVVLLLAMMGSLLLGVLLALGLERWKTRHA